MKIETIRGLIFLLLSVVLFSCFPKEKTALEVEKQMTNPNVIFVMVYDMGSYGQEVIQTPYLDKMAQEGRVFTQAYAGSSVWASSRSDSYMKTHSTCMKAASVSLRL